jgi:hypothetical protein
MSNQYFPSGLPPEFAARFDGILDHLPESIRAGLKEPTLDDLIQESVQDTQAWEESALEGGHLEDQRFAVRRVLYNFKVIEILARLRGKSQSSSSSGEG